ncbi:MAG: sigma-70 family RNA polymerase sigma factor [Bacteroides sp.]|nr:sigma-70 family RNA polymerase sigma factor [Bacteroides sp.]
MEKQRKILLAVQSGSEKAYKELYEQWVSRLYRFVFQYLKSKDASEDVVQETFLRIWSNRANLNPDTSFKSYLFTIAYHFLLKEIRRQLNNPLMEDYVEYLNRLSTETIEVESLMCYDQFVEALEKGKQYLSPRQRTIFEMNKEYGMSIPEISEKLSITNQVTRNQLCMALKILRVELRQYYPLLLLFLKDF